jgi:hypothetical protein
MHMPGREGGGSLVVLLLLAERAASEGPRSTRAVKGNLANSRAVEIDDL